MSITPTTATPQTPMLPPEPWYASANQRAAVLGIVTAAAAVIIDLFGLNVSVQILNVKIALVGQLASLGFNAWAIIKRQRSEIQPLTFTRAGADAMAGTALLDPVTLEKVPPAEGIGPPPLGGASETKQEKES
jgi:hypothetical protein